MVILGGTFDPPHNGHIELASKLFEVFNCQIVFMPNATPTYKSSPQSTNQQRLEMLKLALIDSVRFIIDTKEISQDKYSCSYDTLAEVRQKIGKSLPIYFVIGADSLINLDTWDNWDLLLKLVNIVVIKRYGYKISTVNSSKLLDYFNENLVDQCPTCPYGKFWLLDFMPLNTSSTSIRAMVKNGEDISEVVPMDVVKYIKQYSLYLK